jgi:hypothetical protein
MNADANRNTTSISSSTNSDAVDGEASSPVAAVPRKQLQHDSASFLRENVKAEINKQVVRHKLAKLRHLVIPQAINAAYLDSLFPDLLQSFDPQTVTYNGGVANVTNWKISCYLEVMEGGIPCTTPNETLLELFRPVLNTCNDLFLHWYRQQHACNARARRWTSSVAENAPSMQRCYRLMTFVTRYTPNPGEQALLKHVDGAGKVDGSVVLALPIDKWSAPEEVNAFVGGGLTFWDGKNNANSTQDASTQPREIHYDTRSGDLAFIDRYVRAEPLAPTRQQENVIFRRLHKVSTLWSVFLTHCP